MPESILRSMGINPYKIDMVKSLIKKFFSALGYSIGKKSDGNLVSQVDLNTMEDGFSA